MCQNLSGVQHNMLTNSQYMTTNSFHITFFRLLIKSALTLTIILFLTSAKTNSFLLFQTIIIQVLVSCRLTGFLRTLRQGRRKEFVSVNLMNHRRRGILFLSLVLYVDNLTVNPIMLILFFPKVQLFHPSTYYTIVQQINSNLNALLLM